MTSGKGHLEVQGEKVRDYSKDLDGLAWWMMPSVVWFDMMIIALQAAIIAHNYLHKDEWSDE